MERHPRARRSRRAAGLTLLVAALVLAACGSDTGESGAAADEGQPQVVVTTTILGDIAANVAGEDAAVEVLMPIGADPHDFEPSAQQAASMREADLVIANGLGLEEGLLDAIAAAEEDGVRVLELGPSLDPVPYEGTDGHDHGDEDDHG
ncbi:MAG: metal ABC transporter substrate-binding protein, partial [Nitriliruptoraceae bacterium]